jgi:hypothetical protein
MRMVNQMVSQAWQREEGLSAPHHIAIGAEGSNVHTFPLFGIELEIRTLAFVALVRCEA